MATLNQLANTAKKEIATGDTNIRNADKHYAKAGKALIAAKKKLKHGEWIPWIKNHVLISERRSQELMEIATGKKTVDDIRDRKKRVARSGRAKSALHSADLPIACDFDWSNVTAADFGGDADRAYRAQATHYNREATTLAETHPLLSLNNTRLINDKEIQAMRDVAQVWLDAADKVARLKTKGFYNATNTKDVG